MINEEIAKFENRMLDGSSNNFCGIGFISFATE